MFKRKNLRAVVDSIPRRSSARIAHIKSAMEEDFRTFKIEDTIPNRITYLESVYTFLTHQPQTTPVVRSRWAVFSELQHLKSYVTH